MALHIYSPDWFHGIDTTIEILSIIVAVMVCIYSHKIYRLSKENKYKYFSASFLLIALAYLFKVLSEIVVYSKYVEQKIIGPFIISRVVMEPVIWIHTYSHTMFRLLLMFAFFILLAVTLKIKNKQVLILFSYFLAIITLISMTTQALFHITHVIIIFMIFQHFYDNYTKRRTKQALFVTIAFMGMLLSHIVLVFKTYDPNIYAAGLAFQLAAFTTLLYAFMLVKKK